MREPNQGKWTNEAEINLRDKRALLFLLSTSFSPGKVFLALILMSRARKTRRRRRRRAIDRRPSWQQDRQRERKKQTECVSAYHFHQHLLYRIRNSICVWASQEERKKKTILCCLVFTLLMILMPRFFLHFKQLVSLVCICFFASPPPLPSSQPQHSFFETSSISLSSLGVKHVCTHLDN